MKHKYRTNIGSVIRHRLTGAARRARRDAAAVLFVVLCNVVVASALWMAYVTNADVNRLTAHVEDDIERSRHSFFAMRDAHRQALSAELYGYPMEQMVPYLAQQDPRVAAFLVAIAKKESAWGKRAPVLNGEDCYNYWGFRQARDRMGTGGHTCFDDPRDAVVTVGARVADLIDKQYDTPQKMVVIWKCGSSCRGHTAASVNKWVSDVEYHYDRVYRRL